MYFRHYIVYEEYVCLYVFYEKSLSKHFGNVCYQIYKKHDGTSDRSNNGPCNDSSARNDSGSAAAGRAGVIEIVLSPAPLRGIFISQEIERKMPPMRPAAGGESCKTEFFPGFGRIAS